jgi:hypothetical protein
MERRPAAGLGVGASGAWRRGRREPTVGWPVASSAARGENGR